MARKEDPERHLHLPALAANIRAARESAGLSQSEVSIRTRINISYVNGLENAHHDPTTWTLLRLARALDVQPSKFLDGIE